MLLADRDGDHYLSLRSQKVAVGRENHPPDRRNWQIDEDTVKVKKEIPDDNVAQDLAPLDGRFRARDDSSLFVCSDCAFAVVAVAAQGLVFGLFHSYQGLAQRCCDQRARGSVWGVGSLAQECPREHRGTRMGGCLGRLAEVRSLAVKG
jgi:hypothetical protein